MSVKTNNNNKHNPVRGEIIQLIKLIKLISL